MSKNEENEQGQYEDYNDAVEGVGSLRMSLRERPRKLSAERKLRERSNELRILDAMERERPDNKKKLRRKAGNVGKANTHDENGYIRATGEDLCDCLQRQCPGCHFACKNCGSPKCGIHCRVNRKFAYDFIAFDGKDTIIKNPALDPSSSMNFK